MIEFKVAPRKATMGKMKGKTVYSEVDIDLEESDSQGVKGVAGGCA